MKAHDKAWVVTVLMGLGHLRAAHPLRDLTHEGVIIYGSRRTTPPAEYRIWRRLRRLYYASSKAGAVPPRRQVPGPPDAGRPAHPAVLSEKDQSKPNLAVKYLKRLVEKRGLCRGLRDKLAAARPIRSSIRSMPRPSPWRRSGRRGPARRADQYLLICDADFNRVWVPEDPEEEPDPLSRARAPRSAGGSWPTASPKKPSS